MLATVANMRKLQVESPAPGVFAYSTNTGERYSASPGDYFWMPDDEPLTDEDGYPMILAREDCRIVEIIES